MYRFAARISPDAARSDRDAGSTSRCCEAATRRCASSTTCTTTPTAGPMPTTPTMSRWRCCARRATPASASRCCRCSTRRSGFGGAAARRRAAALHPHAPIRCCACSSGCEPLCEAQGARARLRRRIRCARCRPSACATRSPGSTRIDATAPDPHPHRRADARSRRLPRMERPAAGRLAARPRDGRCALVPGACDAHGRRRVPPRRAQRRGRRPVPDHRGQPRRRHLRLPAAGARPADAGASARTATSASTPPRN